VKWRASTPARQTASNIQHYLASAYYLSPNGEYGYGAQYSWGSYGAGECESIAPSLWAAPGSHLSLAYSFGGPITRMSGCSTSSRAPGRSTQNRRFLRAGRTTTGGYYRVSYRRTLAERVDALGVYTTDPHDPGTFNVKLVWTLSPRQTQ